MKTNSPRHRGISSGLNGTAKAALVSSAIILMTVLVPATGCDQSRTATLNAPVSGDSSSDGPSIDDRLGAPPSDIRFESPVRIFAGEDPISVDEPGYACPTIVDVDGDGADDLVVGQFLNGRMKFYRNENRRGQTPKFAEGDWIKTGRQVANVPGVW